MSENISKIKKTIDFINSTYPNNWVEAYFSGDQLKEKELEENLNHSFESIYNNFCVSILSGEYIEYNNIDDDLKKVEKVLNDNFGIIPPTNNEESAKFLKIVKDGFVDAILSLINLYLNFLKLLETHLNNGNLELLFISSFKTFHILSDDVDEELYNKIRFFSQIIQTNKLDHLFEDSDEIIQFIHTLENEINSNPIINKYKVVVQGKLIFLKYKWGIRQKVNNKNSETHIIKAYLSDNELFLSSDEIIFNSDNIDYNKWKSQIENHYELGDWISYFKKEINKINSKEFKDYLISEILIFIKYHKDITKNIQNLSDIINEIENRINRNDFNKNVYVKLYNYALNNKFSLLIKVGADGKEILDLKKKIENNQIKNNIENFFSEYQYLKYRIDFLERAYSDRKELEKINPIYSGELEKLKITFAEYEKKLSWSSKKFNILFQLPFEESSVSTSLEDLPKLYIASSIALPLPLETSQKNFLILKQRFDRLFLSFSSIESLNKEFAVINNIKSDIKNNNLKTFEYIGVFTAMMTFVFGSITSFKFVESFYQALLFSMVIGGSMILMLMTMFLFTRGFWETIKQWYWFLIPIIMLSCSFLMINKGINNNSDNTQNNIKNSTTTRADSLKVIKHKSNNQSTP